MTIKGRAWVQWTNQRPATELNLHLWTLTLNVNYATSTGLLVLLFANKFLLLLFCHRMSGTGLLGIRWADPSLRYYNFKIRSSYYLLVIKLGLKKRINVTTQHFFNQESMPSHHPAKLTGLCFQGQYQQHICRVKNIEAMVLPDKTEVGQSPNRWNTEA